MNELDILKLARYAIKEKISAKLDRTPDFVDARDYAESIIEMVEKLEWLDGQISNLDPYDDCD